MLSLNSKSIPGRLLTVAAFSLVLAGCNKANSEMTNPVIKPVKLVEVPDLQAQQLDSFIAKIDATERAALSFQVPGEIETIEVQMGEPVSKGMVLAKLDPTDYQLAVDARQAEYDLAETQLKRAQQLMKKKLISRDSFDQAETSYKAAKVALHQAKTDLQYTVITAPFDGVVSLSFAKAHEVVAANQPVLNVIDNSVMDVTFTIPVSYTEIYGLDMIRNGQLSVSMDSHRQYVIPAQFKEVSTQPDMDTNSYTASVTIQRPEELNLLSGMSGQVKLVNTQEPNHYRLADSAWVEKQVQSGVVMRFDPQTQLVNRVEVAIDEHGNVVSGIEKGDLLVEAGVANLMDGQQVKAWTREAGI
ncbi:efflux RND transporter periplasmic adaptor subunit [Vibrio paucivorans]